MPIGGNGMHRGWVGYGSDRDGGKYVENGWQDSWQSGQNTGNSGWDKKQTSDDNWDKFGNQKWSWGNGGSHGWGSWSSDITKNGDSSDSSDSIVQGPEIYTSWGNTNTDSWKSNGGGEGWRKWEADDQGSGSGSREYGGWKSWKSGSGVGRWDSWNSGPNSGSMDSLKRNNKPISAKAEAFAKASIDP
ncbi:unnamed protein product [Acanthocheilonema viteae]|uniref:Uncharacterized protein n=1 Tax=Acanthocheilonema viteae TaxID=6277 RepID=A0A498S7W5_ACAVI|nr:unnamed protein product [Acanthocheilonema viteae]